jgi:cell division protein FtsL
MTKLQKTVITATLAVVAGAGIYEARQASQLRSHIQTLQQQQTPMAEQIGQTQHGYEDATNRLAALRDENERLNRNAAELLKLRGEVGLLRRQIASQQSATNQIQFSFPYSKRESWTEKGTDEPLNTILTMFWAIKQADEAKLGQLVLRMNTTQALDQLTFPKQDWDNITGVQVLNVFEFYPVISGQPEEQANVEVIFEKEQAALDSSDKDEREKQLEVRRWVLKKTNGQWFIISRR